MQREIIPMVIARRYYQNDMIIQNFTKLYKIKYQIEIPLKSYLIK